MPDHDPLVRNLSDTARWVAVYRARETERKDALFRDPYAARLAGERGYAIAAKMDATASNEWAFTARTFLFDRLVDEAVARGADTVVNLAAGLDARPYRMRLPPALRWVEVDLPAILEEKAQALAEETPVCRLERVPTDLADVAARRATFARLASETKKALVVTEGLVIYLSPEEVGQLTRDLAAHAAFAHWAVDIASPGLLKMIQASYQKNIGSAGGMRFGPPEGPRFFEPYGYAPVEVHPLLQTAARHGRLSLLLRMAALLPSSSGRQGARPWSAVCLLERRPPA